MGVFKRLKKISFCEGFFLSAVLSVLAFCIFIFAQAPTLQAWSSGSILAGLCYFSLCVLFDIFVFSKEQNERMQILAGLCLSMVFLVSSGMLGYIFFATDTLSVLKLIGLLFLSSWIFTFCLWGECFAFFKYEERKKEIIDGLIQILKN